DAPAIHRAHCVRKPDADVHPVAPLARGRVDSRQCRLRVRARRQADDPHAPRAARQPLRRAPVQRRGRALRPELPLAEPQRRQRPHRAGRQPGRRGDGRDQRDTDRRRQDPQLRPARPGHRGRTTVAAPNAPCSGPRAFQPAVSLLADPFTAAADTSLTATITLPDRSDGLVGADVALPDGLLGVLNAVPMCGRDLARAGACPPESRIGTVDVAVGNGAAPLHAPGKVFFSQPGADGELARVTVVVPAKAGPYDLGQTIVDELAVKLRQQNGAIGLDNVGVDRLPTIIAGIPIRLREIHLTIDHPGFLRNPLTCDVLQSSASFTSAGGQRATVSAPFQATGCDGLAFTPRLSATLGTAEEPTKVGDHPPLTTVVTQPDHQASIRRSVVTLPSGLFANTAILSRLCTVAQASAGACPDASRVGSARAVSPLVANPLTGAVFIAESPTGGLPRLVMRLSNDLL